MEEWSRRNQYNSFNSWKGLLYAPWYEAIMRKEFLPPIEASIDPIHTCNLRCLHCNAGRYLKDDTVPLQKMETEHLLNIVEFLADWGVKAVCFGGGGEPTMHDDLDKAIILAVAKGMQVGVATNGTLATRESLVDALMLCRWIGVSVDAASRDTYKAIKGVDFFPRLLGNIRDLAYRARGTQCDVAFKFLISEINQYEIADACKLAKGIGARDFHARPADVRHQGVDFKNFKFLEQKLDTDAILQQFHNCHQLEDESFRVFTVVHKFDEEFRPRKNFKQCYAAPLCVQICADGWVYFCVDQRQQEDYRLCKHVPDPSEIKRVWGGNEHINMVFGDTPSFCKTRCTFGTYCEQAEKLFSPKNTDPMCKWFT